MSSPNKHPNASSQSDKLIGQALKLIKKIEVQVVRFHKMSPPEKIKHFQSHRMSSFCTLKTPSGGELLYGNEGEKCFQGLCKILIRFEPQLEGRASYSVVIESVKSAFSDVFLLGSEGIKKESAKKMLESATNKVRLKFKSFEHHIPCIFFIEDSPDVFNIGPVRFTKMDIFLAGAVDGLRRKAEETISQNKWSHSYHERSTDYYKEFSWVASIVIEQCDFEVSFENAIFNCETALNVVRILFGRDRTKWIRLSTSQGESLKAAKIWSVDNDYLQCSLSSRVASPSGPTNWFDYLNNGEGGEIKSFLGQIIEYSRLFKSHSELSSRLLDAINWFGDACLERSPAAAIVKYVTCIERLYFGSQYQGMKSRFSSRVSKILLDFECEGAAQALDSATQVYNVRSTLVHGAVSPRLGDEVWPLYIAEELARNCILSAEQMYRIISHAFNPSTSEEFESAFVTYEKKGLAWCIDEAKLKIKC